jgi:hypothetical protein
VKVIEAAKVNIHAALVKITSGQLPFLGWRTAEWRNDARLSLA